MPTATPSPTMSLAQQLPVEASATLAGRTFQLEVARTPEQQRIGLMFREDLPVDRGMLFPFQRPQPAAFWMFNTRIRLDIIFTLAGEVVFIADNVPTCSALPCPTYGPPSSQLVDNVVELRGGTAAQIGLRVGDPVTITDLRRVPSP